METQATGNLKDDSDESRRQREARVRVLVLVAEASNFQRDELLAVDSTLIAGY